MHEGCVVFHAGTDRIGGVTHATGGRVLAVTALGSTLEKATERAYAGVEAISFEGAHYRRDIGRRLTPLNAAGAAAVPGRWPADDHLSRLRESI